MQSQSKKLNNDSDKLNTKNNNLDKKVNNISELLLNNKEIISSLFLENQQRKDKSLITVKEMEIILEFESNLMLLVEKCPPKMLKDLVESVELDNEHK